MISAEFRISPGFSRHNHCIQFSEQNRYRQQQVRIFTILPGKKGACVMLSRLSSKRTFWAATLFAIGALAYAVTCRQSRAGDTVKVFNAVYRPDVSQTEATMVAYPRYSGGSRSYSYSPSRSYGYSNYSYRPSYSNYGYSNNGYRNYSYRPSYSNYGYSNYGYSNYGNRNYSYRPSYSNYGYSNYSNYSNYGNRNYSYRPSYSNYGYSNYGNRNYSYSPSYRYGYSPYSNYSYSPQYSSYNYQPYTSSYRTYPYYSSYPHNNYFGGGVGISVGGPRFRVGFNTGNFYW